MTNAPEIPTASFSLKIFISARRVNDHPRNGRLGFYRQRRQKTGARRAPIVENNAVKPGAKHPGLENPIKPLAKRKPTVLI
jgi:hypothetical protein